MSLQSAAGYQLHVLSPIYSEPSHIAQQARLLMSVLLWVPEMHLSTPSRRYFTPFYSNNIGFRLPGMRVTFSYCCSSLW